jgi:hypothetical protein
VPSWRYAGLFYSKVGSDGVLWQKQSVFDECDEKYLWRSKEADDHMVNLAQNSQRKISRNAALSK